MAKRVVEPWWKQRMVKWIALGTVCASLTQIGNGWKAFRYVVDTPEVAYAAKQKADTVDEQFNEYLTEQRAYTKALNQVITQQQAPNLPPPQPWTFLREDGDFQQFRDPENVVQCCNGTTCQPLTGKRCR